MSTSKTAADHVRKRWGERASKKATNVFAFNGDVLRLPGPLESLEYIRKGFEFSSVHALANHLGVGDTYVLSVIGVTGGTVARRRQEKVLKPD